MENSHPESGRRPRVAVVFGGRSSEHAVSCVTAAAVLRAVDRDVRDVIPIGVTPNGRWVLASDDPSRWELTGGALPEIKDGDDPGSAPAGRAWLRVLEPGEVPRVLTGVDVVLPLLHGAFGEDGTLQGLLELTGVRYVGSGVLAAAATLDRHVTKVMLAGAGLPVGEHVVVLPSDWPHDAPRIRAAVAELGRPVVVRPARAGSFPVLVNEDGELDAAIEVARRHDPKVVVEPRPVGREITCGVLGSAGGAGPRTSLPGEILGDGGAPGGGARDDVAARLVVPADLPPDLAERVRDLSTRAFVAMGAEGPARVDLVVRPDGQVLIDAIATMPGLTPASVFSRLWAATGLDHAELVAELLA